ncbi:histidine kinase [Aquincola sp. S2]|uniref:Histidine kinase n=1 Tax=Pseudaquabacterium terrae TaxID=2732868 RepID=A0ABX2EDJ0_9BURK|nr:histidine kinase [Aquabacterium terrae]NRF66310.1 histidine kinase [Aquabacterium terrae]
MSTDRIDWSQLWYPGPTRVFSDAELARAGGDRPSRTLVVVVLINVALVVQGLLQVWPAQQMPRLLALLVGLLWPAWHVALALWRRPTRRRLALASVGAGVVCTLLIMALKWRLAGDPSLRWFINTTFIVLLGCTVGFLFVTLYRGHQIDARLRELAEREQAIDMARQLATAQIQPHFLFNSLASLQHWVDAGDPRASSLLQSLTGYLRATLPLFKRERLTLGEELDAAARYLEVMQARLGERLRFVIHADAAARAQPLPPGLLLTLVENAVEHGVGPSIAGAEVQITARRDGERVVVEVRDSGAGLPARLDEGLGLSNSRARLAQAWGEAARLTLLPQPAGGTCARLELPATSVVN